jgi:predicted Holliday junction resolvase-like endonuclease
MCVLLLVIIVLILLCYLIKNIKLRLIKMDVERLKLENVLEVQKIKEYLKGDQVCLRFFNTMLKSLNKRINEDITSKDVLSEEEEEEEPELSDHESDFSETQSNDI